MLIGLHILAPSRVVPGNQLYSAPGVYPFVIPRYNTFSARVRSPSGGGGAGLGYIAPWTAANYGGPGTESRFASATPVIATPGQGGAPGYAYWQEPGAPGTDGMWIWVNGANGAFGSGSGGTLTTGVIAPGAPGAGPYGIFDPNTDPEPSHKTSEFMRGYDGGSMGGYGGWGAQVLKAWGLADAGAPQPNTTINVTVGSHGIGGTHPYGDGYGVHGNNGLDGEVYLEWS